MAHDLESIMTVAERVLDYNAGIARTKDYLRSPEAPMDKLLRYADQCRVGELMRRYLEGMTQKDRRGTPQRQYRKWCRRRDSKDALSFGIK